MSLKFVRGWGPNQEFIWKSVHLKMFKLYYFILKYLHPYLFYRREKHSDMSSPLDSTFLCLSAIPILLFSYLSKACLSFPVQIYRALQQYHSYLQAQPHLLISGWLIRTHSSCGWDPAAVQRHVSWLAALGLVLFHSPSDF